MIGQGLGKVEEVGRVVLGREYRFHQLRKVRIDGEQVVVDVEGAFYRTVCWSRDSRTGQEQVACVGLDGEDEGRIFTCSLLDFVLRFREVEGQPLPPVHEERNVPLRQGAAADPLPEKVADNRMKGSGV